MLFGCCETINSKVNNSKTVAHNKLNLFPVDSIKPFRTPVEELLGKIKYAEHEDFQKANMKYCSKTIYLREEVLAKFEEMYEAAQKDGVVLTILSGTRSFNEQKLIWERKWKKNIQLMDSISAAKKILTYSSMPSTSRHHWGTDIDLNSFENSYFESGKGKKVFDWLVQHASEYGFFMPYDDKNISNRKGYNMEKWHWSYFPLADQFLKEYLSVIKCSDISGFKGANLACSSEIDAIGSYVAGIRP